MSIGKNKSSASTETFSSNLAFLMKKKGVSQAQLAVDIGVSAQRLDKWIGKTCYPKYDIMVALCEYFGYFDIYSMLTVKMK